MVRKGDSVVLVFDEPRIVAQLGQLPSESMVAFATACATRLSPAYLEYSNRTARGSSSAYQTILARLWADVLGDRMTDGTLQEHLEHVMALIPGETDAEWAADQDVAEDAVAALAYALRCRQSSLPNEAAWAARRAYEAVDSFVIRTRGIDTNEPEGESRVIADSVVQTELERQTRDLHDLLAADTEHSQDVVFRVRSRATAEVSVPSSGT